MAIKLIVIAKVIFILYLATKLRKNLIPTSPLGAIKSKNN